MERMAGREGTHAVTGHRDAVEVAFDCRSILPDLIEYSFQEMRSGCRCGGNYEQMSGCGAKRRAETVEAIQAAVAQPSSRCSSAPHVNAVSIFSGIGRAFAAIRRAMYGSIDVGWMRNCAIPSASFSIKCAADHRQFASGSLCFGSGVQAAEVLI
ncbi:MAG: hypothetical protein WBA29_07390 [Xanthobacteraceae bacterium]